MVVGDMEMKVDLLVAGAGPGGYAAAFRAADLGMDVALVDPRRQPGGVCLHEGCIPSKTLLYLAELMEEAKNAKRMGLHFTTPRLELQEIRQWKNDVIASMANGLNGLCHKRGIQQISARIRFDSSASVRLEGGDIARIRFKKAIIASGSSPQVFPGAPYAQNGRVMHSTEALALADVPERLLVVGGGYTGLELGYVYAALGSKVQLVEAGERLLSGVDRDLVALLQQNLTLMFDSIELKTQLLHLEERENGVEAQLETAGASRLESYDRVLVAMGRKPASDTLGLENTRVATTEDGAIKTDASQRTTDENIFAVGDICGGTMLAHTAMRQGRVAAEAAAGEAATYDVRAVPAVVYTNPQIAWCGLQEEEAAAQQINVKVLKFPWKYSGRAASMGAAGGLSKLVTDAADGRILGMGICGRGAEGLIAEGVLAIEMGAVAEDLAMSLHSHPTLSETIGEAAEIFLGSPTHILPGK